MPCLRLEFLRPAAAVPAFDTRELIIRRAQPDSHVRFKGTAFSVPPVLNGQRVIGESVHVRVVHDTPGSSFEILLDGHVLATHTLPAAGVKRVTLEAHAEQIRVAARNSRKPGRAKARYRQESATTGGSTALVLLNAPVVQTREPSDYESLARTA